MDTARCSAASTADCPSSASGSTKTKFAVRARRRPDLVLVVVPGVVEGGEHSWLIAGLQAEVLVGADAGRRGCCLYWSGTSTGIAITADLHQEELTCNRGLGRSARTFRHLCKRVPPLAPRTYTAITHPTHDPTLSTSTVPLTARPGRDRSREGREPMEVLQYAWAAAGPTARTVGTRSATVKRLSSALRAEKARRPWTGHRRPRRRPPRSRSEQYRAVPRLWGTDRSVVPTDVTRPSIVDHNDQRCRCGFCGGRPAALAEEEHPPTGCRKDGCDQGQRRTPCPRRQPPPQSRQRKDG